MCGVALARLDSRVRVVEANSWFYKYFEGSPEGVCGRGFYDFVALGARPKLRRQFAALFDRRQSEFTERIATARSVNPADEVQVVGTAVYGDTGQVDSVVVTMQANRLPVRDEVNLLTEMESKVLEGVAAGLSTDKLAPALNLSRGGVEYHVTRLLRKLKAGNRTSLVARAFAEGILMVGSWPPRVGPCAVTAG